MSELDKLTTEIQPTSLEQIEEKLILNIKEIIAQFEDRLPREKADNFIIGKVKQGMHKSSSLQLIRIFLYREIEGAVFVRGEDSESRATNEKMKKVMRMQADNLINILELSSNNPEAVYYMLGLLLKNVSNTL